MVIGFVIALLALTLLLPYIATVIGLALVMANRAKQGGGEMPKNAVHIQDWDSVDRMVNRIIDISDSKSHQPIYTYDELGELPYEHDLLIERQGCHHGQRKLLMTEIQFMTNCCNACDVIVYSGSAPCEKLPLLLDMFPKHRFLLIDPNYHSFTSSFVCVYQNVPVISNETYKRHNADVQLGKKRNPTHEQQKRFANVKMNLSAPFYKSNLKLDMNDIRNPEHIKTTGELRDAFINGGHRSLFADIVAGTERVYVIQDYMTHSLINLLKESKDEAKVSISFISDIRTNMFSSSPEDFDYIWNDALQAICIKKLRPLFSMLKFHPPYMSDVRGIIPKVMAGDWPDPHGIIAGMVADVKFANTAYGLDMIGAYQSGSGLHPYFANETIYLQAWGPKGTSEARLIISEANIDMKWHNYDHKQWDDRFMYNKLTRGITYHPLFYEMIRDLPGHTYDGCFDCALDIFILMNYISRRDQPYDSTTMDKSKLADELKDDRVKKQLIDLHNKIRRGMVYSSFQKCGFHGQLTKEPVGTHVYVYQYDNGKATTRLWQYSRKADGKLNSKSVAWCDRRTAKFDMVNHGLPVATNLTVPNQQHQRNYVQKAITVRCRGL